MGNEKPEEKTPGGFRASRVLMIIVPVVLITVGVAATFVLLPDFFSGFFRPPLVAVKGEVYWNGKKLDGGMVNTQPENGKLPGASGFINPDGTFELETSTGADFKPGAFVGKHKVTVAQNQRVSLGPSQPPLLTPEKYSAFESTDLTIEVNRDPEKNVFKLQLAGEGPPLVKPRGDADAQQGTPAERAQKMIDQFDADKDGKLSPEEGGRTPVSFGIRNADKNQDGFYDLDEITGMLGGAAAAPPSSGNDM